MAVSDDCAGLQVNLSIGNQQERCLRPDSRGAAATQSAKRPASNETTVKGHLRNIFTKLNVLSRTEAITVASRRGLVQL